MPYSGCRHHIISSRSFDTGIPTHKRPRKKTASSRLGWTCIDTHHSFAFMHVHKYLIFDFATSSGHLRNQYGKIMMYDAISEKSLFFILNDIFENRRRSFLISLSSTEWHNFQSYYFWCVTQQQTARYCMSFLSLPPPHSCMQSPSAFCTSSLFLAGMQANRSTTADRHHRSTGQFPSPIECKAHFPYTIE